MDNCYMAFKRISMLLVVILTGMTIKTAAQEVAVKTNGLYWLATTPNIGLEVATSNKISLELTGAYNPWTFKNNKKLRFWLAQPEVKYWFCEKFEGHFVGIHAHGAQFYSTLAGKRRDGYLAGGGISYGYDWILSPHFNIEAEIGLGYARLWYKESDCIPCMKSYERKHKDYVGPTKVALSLIYIF